ncbi:MAG: hypothetical protein ABDH23_05625 [Endomicrobiia bacterium]
MKVSFIFCSILFFVSANLFPNQKEDIIKIKFIGGIATESDPISNQSLGFWGFAGENIEKQYLDGYEFGMVLDISFTKHFITFLDIFIINSKLFMGKAGNVLKGPAIRAADPHYSSSVSPVLPKDIYYISKASVGRVGIKFTIPSKVDNFNPYIGLAFGIVPYEIGFGNNDGSVAYSEIISDFTYIYSLILGMDFKFSFLNLGLFFDYGAAFTETGVVMNNWIWEGWSYKTQFPVVPAFKFGITFSFDI